jgi:outer membrane usher protein
MEPVAGYAARTPGLGRLWAAPFATLLAIGLAVTLTAAHTHAGKHHGSTASGTSVHHRSHTVLSTRRGPPLSHSEHSTTAPRSSRPRPSPFTHSTTSITSSWSSKISTVRMHRRRVLHSPTAAVVPSFEPKPAAQDERAILSYSVNGVDNGQVVVELRHGDVLVPLADLLRANLHVNPAIVVILGRAYVSLESLAPGIAYAVNQRDLSLTITAQSQYLGPTVVDLSRGNRPREIMYPQNSSFFFNYALDWSNFSQLADFSELGISSHGNLYYTEFNVGPTGRFVRGLTNATFDNPSLMKRWVVGDAFAASGELGGSAYMAGLSVSRNFNLNPYFVRYPGVGISGQTLTPSTAYIYVNGNLVGTQQLPPGAFQINNIPVVAGSGNTQVVVRDAFGRTQTLSSSYNLSTTLLQRGLSQYSYDLGAQRSDVGSTSGHYGHLIFVANDRVGITNWLTAGARLEKSPGLISGGPTASFRLGPGQLGLSAALSRAGGLGGNALQLDYSYQSRNVSFGGTLNEESAHYANVSLTTQQDRAMRFADAYAGAEIGHHASLTLNYSASRSRDSGWSHAVSLAGAVQLSNNFDLTVTASRLRDGSNNAGNQYFVGLNYQVGRNTLGAVSQQGGTAGSGNGVSVQQSLPLGSGVGYLISHGTGSEVHDQDIFQYQTPLGLYQASYLQTGGSRHVDVLVSGGVIDAGDGIMFTRAVKDSFAVLKLPELRGVRGYFNNQFVGRTDEKGRLLIPDLLSYYGNRVQISDQDIPLDYSIVSTEVTVAPSYRGGALVRFPVERVQAAKGVIFVDRPNKVSIPSFGVLRLSVNGRQLESELGAQGEFYLENVAPGTYSGVVDYADGSCDVHMAIPKKRAPLSDIGLIRCTSNSVLGSAP